MHSHMYPLKFKVMFMLNYVHVLLPCATKNCYVNFVIHEMELFFYYYGNIASEPFHPTLTRSLDVHYSLAEFDVRRVYLKLRFEYVAKSDYRFRWKKLRWSPQLLYIPQKAIRVFLQKSNRTCWQAVNSVGQSSKERGRLFITCMSRIMCLWIIAKFAGDLLDDPIPHKHMSVIKKKAIIARNTVTVITWSSLFPNTVDCTFLVHFHEKAIIQKGAIIPIVTTNRVW